MVQTGRSPYDTTDVVPFGLGTRRLSPLANLGEASSTVLLDAGFTASVEMSLEFIAREAATAARCATA